MKRRGHGRSKGVEVDREVGAAARFVGPIAPADCLGPSRRPTRKIERRRSLPAMRRLMPSPIRRKSRAISHGRTRSRPRSADDGDRRGAPCAEECARYGRLHLSAVAGIDEHVARLGQEGFGKGQLTCPARAGRCNLRSGLSRRGTARYGLPPCGGVLVGAGGAVQFSSPWRRALASAQSAR